MTTGQHDMLQVQPRPFLNLNAYEEENAEDGNSVVNVVDQRTGEQEEEAENDSRSSTPASAHCRPKKEASASLGNSHNSTPTTPNISNPLVEPFPNFDLFMKSPMAPLFFGAAFPQNPLLGAGLTTTPPNAQNDFALATMSMLHQSMVNKQQGTNMFPPGHPQLNRQEVMNKNHLKRALSGMVRGAQTPNGSQHHQNHQRVLNSSTPPIPGSVAVANSPAAKLFSKDDWSWHRNPAAIRSGGTNKQTPVWKYFVYNKAENLSRCVVGDCTYMLKGPHTSTLACHLKKHQTEYAEFQRLKLEYSHERNSSQGSSERGVGGNRRAGNNGTSPISPTSSTTSLSVDMHRGSEESREKEMRSGREGIGRGLVEERCSSNAADRGMKEGSDAAIKPNGIFVGTGCGLPLALAGLPFAGFAQLQKESSSFPSKPSSGNEVKGHGNAAAEKPPPPQQQNNYTAMSDILSLLNARAVAKARDGADGQKPTGSIITPSSPPKLAQHPRHSSSKSSFRSVLDLASSSQPNGPAEESNPLTDGATHGEEAGESWGKPLEALSLALFSSGISFDVMRNPLLEGFIQQNSLSPDGKKLAPHAIVEERLDVMKESVIRKLADADGGVAVVVDIISPAASINSALSVACSALGQTEGPEGRGEDYTPYFVGLLPIESEQIQPKVLLLKLEKLLRAYDPAVAEKTRFVIAPGSTLARDNSNDLLEGDDEDCNGSLFDRGRMRVLKAYLRKVRKVMDDFSAGSKAATAIRVQDEVGESLITVQQPSGGWAQLFVSAANTFNTGAVVDNLVSRPESLAELSKVITLRFNRSDSL